MAAKNHQKRKGVDASPGRIVKTTVSLDAATLAKLAACAALRGSSQSTLAAAFIREGLRGVVAFDKSMSSASVDTTNRPGLEGDVDISEGEAA